MVVLVLDVGLVEVEVEVELELADDEEAEEVVVSDPRMGRSGSSPSPDEVVCDVELKGADVELPDDAGAAGATGLAGVVDVGRAGTEAPEVGCDAPPADWPASDVASGASKGFTSGTRTNAAITKVARAPTANRPASNARRRPADEEPKGSSKPRLAGGLGPGMPEDALGTTPAGSPGVVPVFEKWPNTRNRAPAPPFLYMAPKSRDP